MTYWKNYPNEDTPLEADNLDDFEKRIIGLMHPINTGFIAYDDTDYSDYLGFTWEKTLIGRTPVWLDNTQTEFSFIGKQGGANINLDVSAYDYLEVYVKYLAGTNTMKMDLNTTVSNYSGAVYGSSLVAMAWNNGLYSIKI